MVREGSEHKLGSGAMFDRIAGGYDRLNRVLSFGMDHHWRRVAVGRVNAQPGQTVLDLATGTGDLALRLLRKVPDTQVIGIDPSMEMLRIARRKATEQDVSDRLDLQLGDAMALSLDENSVDHAMVAFGFRNFPDRLRGLSELARVVRPGGHLVILELSEPREGMLGAGARLYIRRVVPKLGALLSGSREYTYLQQSIAEFPSADAVCVKMERAGFHDVQVTSLTFGVVQVFSGSQ